MAVITVRNIPNPTKEALRVKAASAGVSLEQYVRTLLQKASVEESNDESNIMEIAASYFSDIPKAKHQDDDLELPTRASAREKVEFKE